MQADIEGKPFHPVGQRFIRLVDLIPPVDIAAVIGMIFSRKIAVCGFYFGVRARRSDAEYLVIIFETHIRPKK